MSTKACSTSTQEHGTNFTLQSRSLSSNGSRSRPRVCTGTGAGTYTVLFQLIEAVTTLAYSCQLCSSSLYLTVTVQLLLYGRVLHPAI